MIFKRRKKSLQKLEELQIKILTHAQSIQNIILQLLNIPRSIVHDIITRIKRENRIESKKCKRTTGEINDEEPMFYPSIN